MKINKFKLFAILKYIWFPIFLVCRIIRSVIWWETQPSFKNWTFTKYWYSDLILLGSIAVSYFAPLYITIILICVFCVLWLAIVLDAYNKQL